MIELAQLFQDMEAAVVQQEAPIEHIDNKAEDTVVHLDKGNEQLNQAVDKARSARRKKWICLGIFGKSSLKPVIIEGQWALTLASHNHPYHCGCYCYCSGGHKALTWIRRIALVFCERVTWQLATLFTVYYPAFVPCCSSFVSSSGCFLQSTIIFSFVISTSKKCGSLSVFPYSIYVG